MLAPIIYFLLGILALSTGEPSKRFPPETDIRPWKSPRDTEITQEIRPNARLPSNVVPSHYILFLRTILEDGPNQFTAPGNVTINIQVVEPTSSITFHTKTISIEEESIKVTNGNSGDEVPIESHSFNEEDDTYTLTLGEELQVSQEYILSIGFVANIPDRPFAGLYRSNYTDPITNEIKYVASTQFERSDARRAFPCFDEPLFRATFQINLGRTEDYHTLSNMQISETTADTEHPGYVWDHYDISVNMPTYLVAFVISDYVSEAAPPESFDGKISAVWTDSGRMAPGAGTYAAEISARVIQYYENRWDAKYDLPKLDSASIPEFSLGAMENWGLVLYRDYLLLYYNGTTTENSRRSIVSVIAHELAHQWFGNILTMKWWNDMWLKEGFASYIQYWGIEAMGTEFDAYNWIVSDSYQGAMRFDAGTPDSQPISNDGVNPSTIIYSKGASIIRMMEGFLSEATFTEALRKYLDKHAYGTVDQDDLWEALNEQALLDGTLDPNLTVKLIMDTWTHQSGLPVVRVMATGPNEITVSQESYGNFSRKINTTALNPDELWYVPISYHNEDNPEHTGANRLPKLWIPKNATSATHEVDTTKWLLVNTAAMGFYRVLYDDPLRKMIVEQLNQDASVISTASRGQLMDDYFRFCNDPQPDGEFYAPVEHALEFTLYLAQEISLAPWEIFFNNIGRSFDIFSGSGRFYPFFKDYFGKRINSSLHLIGVEQSPQANQGNNVILRNRLLQWGCQFGLPACYEYANKLRLEWVENNLINPVPVDIRPTMYCAIMAAGGQAAYYFVMGTYFEDTTAWKNALGCATEPDVIDMVLELSLDPQSGISKEEAAGLLVRVGMSPEGRPRLWEFLLNRFAAINDYHGIDAISEALKTLSDYQGDPEDIAKLENFWETHEVSLAPIGNQFTELMEKMMLLQSWMDTRGQRMVSFFLAHQ